MAEETILEKVGYNRVFSVEWDENTKTFDVWECCDRYYVCELSPEELKKLGLELIALAESKSDV